ncbi:hypothetical protein JHK85_008910 [Glycine max]|nr:hypothetical protein JHK85_008910 [Glycine max]KAG5064940.1 hypothetical protein JHK86_008671 [Glycine max]
MDFFSTIFGHFGFGFGISMGLVIGYFLFIYVQSTEVKVDWLNKLIEYMWPYLEKAICKTAKNIAKPIIDEQIPKYKIDSVEFEELTRVFAANFSRMKVYETDEKELIMESSVKWAGNPNAIVALKKFGLKATIQTDETCYTLTPYSLETER